MIKFAILKSLEKEIMGADIEILLSLHLAPEDTTALNCFMFKINS